MKSYYELIAHKSLLNRGELLVSKEYHISRYDTDQLINLTFGVIGVCFVVKEIGTKRFSVMRRLEDKSLRTIVAYEDRDPAVMAWRLLV